MRTTGEPSEVDGQKKVRVLSPTEDGMEKGDAVKEPKRQEGKSFN